jgi:hypothetical protein
MPVDTVNGTEYHLISYTAHGAERLENGRHHSDDIARRMATGAITDLILLSHGWNGDLPAARDQYRRWITTMLECRRDRELVTSAAPDFQPLIVGLHWPSKAWGDENLGDESLVAVSEPAISTHASVDMLVEDYAERLSDTPAAHTALRTIVESALEDISPTTLPADVRAAYHVLDAEAGPSALGPGAQPGDDREPFDAETVYQAAQLEDQLVPYGAGGFLGGLLAPLRVLTFWQMKRRARDFGETGAAGLLRKLQAAVPPEQTVRVHLMGHSFGCIVTSACVAGPPGREPARVDSLSLVQGALSLWAYCSAIPNAPGRAGYFHTLIAQRLVRGPIVVTTSEHDRAVGSFYPLGAGVAGQVDFGPGQLPRYGGIGTFGARGPLPTTEDRDAHAVEEPYDLRPGVIYNIDCSLPIRNGRGPAGAHNDICHPEIAHLVWSAILSAISARREPSR